MKALKFAWRYGSLYVMKFECFEDAVEDAILAADEGAEALDHIEYNGKRYTFGSPEVKDIEERLKGERDNEPSVPTPWKVEISDGEKWALNDFYSDTEVGNVMLEWESLVGADRVRAERS
jgi:hypothetical protein